MPFYLKNDDRVLLKKLKKVCVCAECNGKLESYYDIDEHSAYLICKANSEHEGIAKEYREPIEIINPYGKINKRGKQ